MHLVVFEASLCTVCSHAAYIHIPAFDLPADGVIRKSPERGKMSAKSITKTVEL